jgi:hypothetical protein
MVSERQSVKKDLSIWHNFKNHRDSVMNGIEQIYEPYTQKYSSRLSQVSLKQNLYITKLAEYIKSDSHEKTYSTNTKKNQIVKSSMTDKQRFIIN